MSIMRPKLRIYFQPGTDLGSVDQASLKSDLGLTGGFGAGSDSRAGGTYWLANPVGDDYNRAGLSRHPEVLRVVPNTR